MRDIPTRKAVAEQKRAACGRFGILNTLCLFRLSFWAEHLDLFCRFYCSRLYPHETNACAFVSSLGFFSDA